MNRAFGLSANTGSPLYSWIAGLSTSSSVILCYVGCLLLVEKLVHRVGWVHGYNLPRLYTTTGLPAFCPVAYLLAEMADINDGRYREERPDDTEDPYVDCFVG